MLALQQDIVVSDNKDFKILHPMFLLTVKKIKLLITNFNNTEYWNKSAMPLL